MSALAPVIPDDIRHLADLIARRREERQFAIGGQTTKAIADDVARALIAERERCASHLEQKALLMRGSVTGDMMARIFEAEAIAIRNAHTLVHAPQRTQANPHLPSGAAACSADTSVATLLPATEGQSEEQNSLSTPTHSYPDSDTAGAGASAPAVPIIVMKHEELRA